MKLLLPFVLVLSAMNAFSQIPPPETLATPGVSHDLAIWRAAHYSDVRYKLDLTLEKMSPVLKGTLEIRVKVSPGAQASLPASPQGGEIPPIVLDWRKLAGHEKDSTIVNAEINGQKVQSASFSSSERDKSRTLTFDESNEHLIFRDGVVLGGNVIKLDFTSPILTSGAGVTRYIDREDGSEYIYSLFVPSDASTAFPVFDQPDLKATFQVNISAPVDWKVITNTPMLDLLVTECSNTNDPRCGGRQLRFSETKPISTYVFAFAAGPWQEFSAPGVTGGNATVTERAPSKPAQASDTTDNSAAKVGGTLPNGRVSARDDEPLTTHIYVRRSQAAKFQPHAAEVFKMMREGVKYLEDYFDYKFPWPKYDLVLIPEFPFGGMEHAGETFVRESAIIFPSEPTKNDQISRATLIFHETAHQWFGDTVTMRWFDDLWLKEGFANFMAYKALEKIMPEMNSWKAFYERIKQPAYVTDSTKGTTPIYQPIDNLSAAKSAYGNIVYNKAPAFLRQAEFYLGEDKFQTAVRAFLKKHEFANGEWKDLSNEFVAVGGEYAGFLASNWVSQRGMPKFTYAFSGQPATAFLEQSNVIGASETWWTEFNVLTLSKSPTTGEYEKRVVRVGTVPYRQTRGLVFWQYSSKSKDIENPDVVFPNYGDYGYGIFLLDDKSRDYVLKNIQNEKDDFLRSMMWGALWDSVREAELDPRVYVELAIKNLPTEKDEMITSSVLGRVSTAMTYYISDTGGNATVTERASTKPIATSGQLGARSLTVASLPVRLETMLIDRMRTAPTLGQRLTYYRAFLNIVSTENGRSVLKQILKGEFGTTGGNATVTERAPAQPNTARSLTVASLPVKTKDKFDIVTRLAILGDPDAPKLLADLEKTETSDDAKRYAYAARAAFATKENREKFWTDFVSNKDISESWIEAAMGPFNSPKHSDLSLPYLQRALTELPNLKRTRKIFFINGWLGAFLGGQKSQEALDIVNKFLADNPNLDRDLRLKILENVDVIERAVKIRSKYGKS